MSGPQRLARRPVHRGRVIAVTVDTVRLADGRTLELDQVQHPGAAAVVPVDGAGDVLLVRQPRYATGGWLLEVPAGKIDAGETPLQCAGRELEEEVGQVAARLRPLGSIWTTPGFCDERIHLYLGQDLTATRQALDPDEEIEVCRMPLGAAVQAALSGAIEDAKTVCALLRAAATLRQP